MDYYLVSLFGAGVFMFVLWKTIEWSSDWAGWRSGTDARLKDLERRIDRLESVKRNSKDNLS